MLWRPALRSVSYLHYSQLGRASELFSPRKAFLRQFTITCQHRNTLPLASSTVLPIMTQVLTAADGPLVWIDCEMTGLDSKTDKILEIAVSST
jgi:DNA polymerase III epsilon subunit-like protein